MHIYIYLYIYNRRLNDLNLEHAPKKIGFLINLIKLSVKQ